jgi:class 3 adenylate cyclase
MRLSVAAKIFSIAVMVIVAMAVVSGVNLISARNVADGIQRITGVYLEIYGAAARVNVYSNEEAYRTRQYITEKALGMHHAGSDRDATLARLRALDRVVQASLVDARARAAKELAETTGAAESAAMARIDERLARLQAQERDHLAVQTRLIDAYDRGDMAQFNERFDALTQWRAQYDPEVDQTRWMIFTAAREAGREVTRVQREATIFSVALLVLAGVLALGAALVLSRQLVRPLEELLAGIRSISSGRLEVEVPVKTQDEIGRLTEAFNDMTQELRVGVRARELFGTYIDARVARELMDAPHALGEAGERRTMTVMFCDLQAFTRMSEQMTPRGLVSVMNRHFTLMSEAVRANGGVIDKFIGDALMAYWGAPFVPEAEQGALAVASALSQLEKMTQLAAELPDLVNLKQGLATPTLRIGIATGEVLVGSIGSDMMRNFTVMGDAVNLASRLEGANKLYGTHALISEATARYLGGEVVVREIDSLIVLGQSEPVRIFDLIGRAGDVSPAQRAACEAFEAGLAAYRRQDWTAARAAFGKALELVPEDPPSRLFLKRIEEFSRAPPQGPWNGVWEMETK